MNEQVLLAQIRDCGPVSRAELAQITGLSKPTVGLALANLEQDGLIRSAGQRTGVRGPAALLYEVRPDAGYVLGLDVGREFLRGALSDLTGSVRAKATRRASSASAPRTLAELTSLAEELAAAAGISRASVSQTVIGSPGVYDPERGVLTLVGHLPGWERPQVLAQLRQLFGPETAVENDVDLAAVAERDFGHGRGVGTFCFVSVGTGVGMGLVVDGQLHRGAHGTAGEIAFLPIEGSFVDPADARRFGTLEASAAAAAIVAAGRRAGVRGVTSARRVFAAASGGDERAAAIVAAEAELIAKAIASITAVVDPELVVLGGGIGKAPGFAEAVGKALEGLVPFRPRVLASALGDDAVVDGCLAAGLERAWERALVRS
jgi:predicted NBD/HSP70 family sugar kinase